MSESAAVFLESLTSDLDKKKEFQNQHAALPYVQVVHAPVETEYRGAVCELPPQMVPAEAVALTCGIDRQKIGSYFLVRAWARDYTSWLIHYGKLAAWEDIERLLFETTYPVAGSGRQMAIARAAMDTGGSKFGEHSMYEEAVFWIRKNGIGRGARVWGVQGASWPQPNKIKMSKPIDKTPSGKPIPGGLQILTLDTEKFKDAFFYRLSQAVEKAELAAYLHADTDDAYFAHITAEEKRENDKGILSWVQKGSRRNDWLDCEVYAAAAADPEWPEGGVHLISRGRKRGREDAEGDTGSHNTNDRRVSSRW
jgi:phage terminase large subunit GpA-like protein